MVNREGTFVCQSFESESFSDLLIRSGFLGSDWTFQNFKGKKPLELGLFFFFLKISINTISMYVFVDGNCLVIFINNWKSQGSFSCVLQNFILYMYFLYWWSEVCYFTWTPCLTEIEQQRTEEKSGRGLYLQNC